MTPQERWFELFKAALTGAIAVGSASEDAVRCAATAADLGMNEVNDRRGTDVAIVKLLRAVEAVGSVTDPRHLPIEVFHALFEAADAVKAARS